jgi:hypothetical protein
MRSMVMLAVLSVTACAQMSEPSTRVSQALAQTQSTTWQGEDGKILSAAQVEQAYRACQSSVFSPSRASKAMSGFLEDEDNRLALTDPELNVCMRSFGYSRVGSPTEAPAGAKNAAG